MRGWLGALIGVLLLVTAIIAFAPATLLDAPLALRSGDRLRLVAASGPWWRGRGLLANDDTRLPIAWRVDVLSLLRSVVAVRLVGDDATPTGTITMTDGRIEIADLGLRVPAAIVGAADPRLQSVTLGGSIAVNSPTFVFDRNARSGTLHATWERARAVVGDVVAVLGTVSLNLARAGDHVSGTIRNAGGELTIEGTLIDRAGVIEINVTLRPTESTPDNVRSALPLLGAPDAAGGVRIAWRADR